MGDADTSLHTTQGTPMIDLGRILSFAMDMEASDIHLKVPAPPALRIHGRSVWKRVRLAALPLSL